MCLVYFMDVRRDVYVPNGVMRVIVVLVIVFRTAIKEILIPGKRE